MKKPVMILTSLAVVSASAVATFVPPASGAPPDATDRKLQGLSQAGLMPPAQAEALKRARAAASGRANEVNSAMPTQAKENAPGRPGAQLAPPSAPNGQASPAALPPVPTPPPAPPRWRLEGTMVGGNRAPSAMFVVEGWGPVLVHPGEKLNDVTKVMSIKGDQVTLLTDGKKLERVSPW